MKSLSQKLIELFFPGNCLSCGSKPGDNYFTLCNVCADQILPLTTLTPHQCVQCSKPLLIPEKEMCYACSSKSENYFANYSLYSYQDPLTTLIYRHFKIHRYKLAGKDLAALWKIPLTQAIEDRQADLIVPVPVSPMQLRKRGFNQTSLILSYCAVTYADILIRKNHKTSQKSLDYHHRKQEIMGQFSIKKEEMGRIQGKHILLIDDIYTTGSTVEECCRILMQNGAAWISVITFMRS